MEYLSESNFYKEVMPVHAAYYNYDSSSLRHWHPETELFFVLSGTAHVTVEEQSFTVQPEDVFLVNSNDVHLIEGNDCEMFSLQFWIDRLPYFNAARIPRFHLCSAANTHAPRYDYVRYLMAQFVRMNENGEHIYKVLSIIFTLYSHLTENFIAPPLAAVSLSRRNHERVLTIMEYISEHYTECLTLSAVAKAQNLSAPYLASFFEKNTGKTFLTYYNEIRLSHAVNALLSSDESIEAIALANGFGDVRSFTALFKKKYGELPSAYRKAHARPSADEPYSLFTVANEVDEFSKKSIAKILGAPSLIKYQNVFQNDTKAPYVLQSAARIMDAGSICFSDSGIPLRHTHHRLMCVGSAKQLLYHEVQEMVRRTQKEIRYDYVKFHGILSDDMMVYSETADGTPLYSFTFIDKAIDFLLSVGLRPFCQFSFMPVALSSDPNRMVDFYHYNTAPPKDMKKWKDLIEAVTRHFVSRYGLAEVRKWLFCVWNEPDETVNEFSWPDRRQFFDFYRITYETVKAIDSGFLFGTPSLLLSITEENGWAADFFRYLRDSGCPPDFLNIHYYDNTLFDSDMRDRTRPEGFSAENMSLFFPLTVDPYAFMKFINNIKLLLKRHQMKSIPVYLTEWNLTISHRDPINDTCFKACYLIKNLLENYDRLESFGYWCLTDFIEELQIPNELYHGGLGLFTYNGIPKSHYNAFRFLTGLGDELIGKGNGYFITKKENRIAILLYNYEHYSKLFASGARTRLPDQNRYALFPEMNHAEFSVQFCGLPCERCLVKERFINQNHGSSYDAWVRMGAQPLTTEYDLDLLRQQSQPGMYLHQETTADHKLSLRVQMAPLEVRFIEIEFII